MKNTYSEKINNDLKNIYEEVDYSYDEMFEKDINKDLVDLYKELSNEMTFNYDEGPDSIKKRMAKANSLFNENDDFVETKSTKNNRISKNLFVKKPKSNKPMSNTKKVVLGIILTIAVGVFLVSALKLISIKKAYDDSKNAYDDINNDFFKGDTDNVDELDWDFTELFSKNPEVIGYIYCPDLLSYPVVQGSDNSFYLTHLFTGEYNASGSIFADCNLPDKFESRNCIIYGHNMRDGSMFSKLHNYSDANGIDYYNNHKEFHIFTTDNHHYVYKVVSVYTASITSNIYATNLNDEQFSALLGEIQAESPYKTEHKELTLDSKIMTLSTCTMNSDYAYRQIVVLVRDREIQKKDNKEKNQTPATTIDE